MDEPSIGGAASGALDGMAALDDAAIGAAPSSFVHSRVQESAPSRGAGAAKQRARGGRGRGGAAAPTPLVLSPSEQVPAASGGVREAESVEDRSGPKLKDCPEEYIEGQMRLVKFPQLTAEAQQKMLNRVLTTAEKNAFEWKNCDTYNPPHDDWPKYAKRGKFINLHRANYSTPAACFFAFFTPTLMALHRDETNRHLLTLHPDASLVSLFELPAFYGIQIIMGLMPHPRLEEFWRKQPADTPPHVAHPNFQHIMSYKRYRQIKDALHFANNDLDTRVDPLFKLRPAIDTFRSTFKKYFRTGTDVCIDEGIIPFKGVNPHRRKIPKPGGSTGFKVLILADSDIHYCYDFIIDACSESQSIREHIEPLVNNLSRGQVLYCDRWFGTIAVVDWLKSLQIGYVGTFLENRNPAKMCQLPPHSPKGAFKACQKDGICICRWEDTSQCCFIMTAVGISEVQYARKQKTGANAGQKIPIPAPAAAKKFNFKMGGVDRFDQMKAKFYSCCGRFKTKKWYHKLWFGIVDILLVNAWLLYKHTQNDAKHFDFVHTLAQQLTAPYLLEKQEAQPQTTSTTHLVHFSADPATGARPQRACYACSTATKRIRTTFGCSSCQRALCLTCYSQHKKCYPPAKKPKFDFPDHE